MFAGFMVSFLKKGDLVGIGLGIPIVEIRRSDDNNGEFPYQFPCLLLLGPFWLKNIS